MLIKKADGGDVSPAKVPKASFFSRPGAVSKRHAAKVLQDHAPTTDAYGITQTLKKAKIAKSTKTQRDRALVIWGE